MGRAKRSLSPPPPQSSPASLSHPVSPPRKRRREDAEPRADSPQPASSSSAPASAGRVFPSPFQLTRIQGLSPSSNVDAVALQDLLGDPLIAECWEFNFLHDIDFLMSAFDDDVRHLVRVHVVHGSWRKEDPARIRLEAEASRYENVTLHQAYMPEMFGTHHTKMMILLRHDDTAQIIIHTANLIVQDWRNMTQAVWPSPRLPRHRQPPAWPSKVSHRFGSGEKFKVDFLNYLGAYDTRRPTCKAILHELVKYDFSAIRGALVGSVPGRHSNGSGATSWGLRAMRDVLKTVPVKPGKEGSDIVAQVSSIATLGPTDHWLRRTFCSALSSSPAGEDAKPNFKVVFPTPDEIRRSLDGYASGGSIHARFQSGQQIKQLQYMRPMFYHWANDCPDGAALGQGITAKEAGRKRAAPHIKTYIRYSRSEDSIDWALLTSANLSKQAWGEVSAKGGGDGELRIASYELGVLVWPALFANDAVMRPTFGTDTPTRPSGGGGLTHSGSGTETVVGLRMPYSLPLQKYGEQEMPWVATASHVEPDWMGRLWQSR